MMADDSAVYETLKPNLGFLSVGGRFDFTVPYSLILD
jgi:hypothetical protein